MLGKASVKPGCRVLTNAKAQYQTVSTVYLYIQAPDFYNPHTAVKDACLAPIDPLCCPRSRGLLGSGHLDHQLV